MSTKKTGSRISTWIVEVIIPPTIGAAIGFITSGPILLSNRIGIRLASTAVTVISFGRAAALPLNRCRLNIGIGEWNARSQLVVESFLKIDDLARGGDIDRRVYRSC